MPGGKAIPDYRINKDQWFYFEEVFTRESAEAMQDGSYRLYVSPADNVVLTPVVEQNNITIRRLVDMSINGNF